MKAGISLGKWSFRLPRPHPPPAQFQLFLWWSTHHKTQQGQNNGSLKLRVTSFVSIPLQLGNKSRQWSKLQTTSFVDLQRLEFCLFSIVFFVALQSVLSPVQSVCCLYFLASRGEIRYIDHKVIETRKAPS